MITYIVTVKQEVVQEHRTTIEINARSAEDAMKAARLLLQNGSLTVEHHLSAKGFIRDPEVVSVDPVQEFDEAV